MLARVWLLIIERTVRDMKYRYYRLNGALLAYNAMVVDMQSKSATWKGYYNGFTGNGRRIPVTPQQIRDELTEIKKEEYIKQTQGYYTPTKYI